MSNCSKDSLTQMNTPRGRLASPKKSPSEPYLSNASSYGSTKPIVQLIRLFTSLPILPVSKSPIEAERNRHESYRTDLCSELFSTRERRQAGRLVGWLMSGVASEVFVFRQENQRILGYCTRAVRAFVPQDLDPDRGISGHWQDRGRCGKVKGEVGTLGS